MLLREKVGLRPRTQKRYPPSERLQTPAPPGDGRAQAVDLWWLPLGGFRFLEPLAPSNQQQHTRPQSAGCTFPRTLRGRSGEFSWSCTDTLEALIVAYDSFNYHSQPGSGLLTAATQVLQFPLCATFRTGFFGFVSGMVEYLQCSFGIHTSIAQQNANRCDGVRELSSWRAQRLPASWVIASRCKQRARPVFQACSTTTRFLGRATSQPGSSVTFWNDNVPAVTVWDPHEHHVAQRVRVLLSRSVQKV